MDVRPGEPAPQASALPHIAVAATCLAEMEGGKALFSGLRKSVIMIVPPC